jgi:glycosyltransferase involved in cell wall biosynthesis
MIGDGPEGAGLRAAHARSPQAGRIHLLGHRDDVRELVRDFDLFVMSSRYEGLPLVVFEAMSLGVPVVATDVGATRECVGDGLGEVVPADAPPEVLAGAAARWLARRHDVALRAACRERICTRFDVRTMQQRYRDEFATLAAECDRVARWRTFADTLMRRSFL